MCVACGPEIMTVAVMAADAACYVRASARVAVLEDALQAARDLATAYIAEAGRLRALVVGAGAP